MVYTNNKAGSDSESGLAHCGIMSEKIKLISPENVLQIKIAFLFFF